MRRIALLKCLCRVVATFALLAGAAAVMPPGIAFAAADTSVVLEVESKGKVFIDKEIARRSTEIIKKRLQAADLADALAEQTGDRAITVRFNSGGKGADELIKKLIRPLLLEFRMVIDDASPDDPPEDAEVLYEAQMNTAGEIREIPYVVGKKAVLSGDIISGAAVGFFQERPLITLELNEKGAELFAKVTEEAIGRRMAVVLDGNVLSAPRIQERISGGTLQITGNLTLEEARDVAATLNSGFFPAPVRVVEKSDLKNPSQEGDVDAIPETRAAQRTNDYAVVIGIERYRDIKGVEFAERDAATMKAYLIRLLGFPEENVAILSSDRAAKSDLEKYLGNWLGNRVGPGSTVFVYYAGHGAPNPKTGEPFIIPYDGDPNYLDSTAVPVKELYAKLAKLPARQVVVVLDSCFSGAGGRSVLAKGARPLVMTSDAPPVLNDRLIVFAAAGSNQISTSQEAARHGLFTYFFLRGLKGEAASGKDGSVTVESLYRYLQPQVEKNARLQNVEQVPVLVPGLDALGERKQIRLR